MGTTTAEARPAREGTGFGDGLLRAYLHCPECGGERMRVTSDGEATNLLCLSCHRCWHPEAGFISPVDPRTCPGCNSMNLCLGRVVAPLVNFGLGHGLGPRP
jgi:hypothetical protein